MEPAIARAVAPALPRVLVFTTLFPNPAQPRHGLFVRHRVVAVAEHCPTRIVAPVLSRPDRWHLERTVRIPHRREEDGVEVVHPRYTTVPGVARFADGLLLFLQSLPAVRRLHAESCIDLIDAHYGFPDGTAAVLLGRVLGVPVTITTRGGDVEMLTRYRLRRRIIAWTLRRADRVFAVSEHLAGAAEGLGVPRGRLRVVPNGVDATTFTYIDRAAARRELTLPPDAPLVLFVANLIAEKGLHVLIEAFARLTTNGTPAPRLCIIGGDPTARAAYQRQIEARVVQLGLTDRVAFLGSRPQQELRVWYGAADVLALPTFREGCPNVVREGLACGVPIVASGVGGVPELVTSDAVGLLVPPGDAVALSTALRTVLARQWDRRAIAATAGQRSWATVAERIVEELRAVAAAA